MSEATPGEWMDPFFAMFNCHVNDAQEKADRAFIEKFGKREWNRRIKPLHSSGIMGIFKQYPDEWLRFYVDSVHAFVNEGRAKPTEAE